MRRFVVRAIGIALCGLLPGRSVLFAAEPSLAPPRSTAVAAVEARANELADLNHTIWQYAEVGLAEHKSSAALIQKLKDNGFDVKAGIAHMPTAFVASYGEGSPVIGILAEYDALPGLSQQTTPQRQPVEEGGAGHGCGHSGLGAAAVGAAIAVKEAMQKHGIPGTIRLYGTPAEETLIGKVYMALDGQFDDLDLCLHYHPADKNAVWGGSSKAAVSVKFTFHGLPAHAAVSPHEGKSALDAVELMNAGVNFMREHVKEDCRMHYVITNGGGQPNVVPPEATVWYFLRADSHDDVERYFHWLQDIAKGAALMTRTTVDFHVDTDCHEIIPNDALSEVLQQNLTAVRPPKFTPEEHLFATRVQESLKEQFAKTIPTSLREEVEPLSAANEISKGSTDVGDISWQVPTAGLRTVCFAAESPGHSWQNVACIGSSIGDKGCVYAAKVLAATAVQLFQDEGLRTAAKAEFNGRMKDRNYTTLIPEGQHAPVSIR